MGRMRRTTPAASARDRLRATGERVTGARVRVLEFLMRADCALTHPEIEAGLGAEPLDRVTLYRVLDWLVAQGLAHRVAGDDRVRRFSMAGDAHGHHAHFQCSGCGRVLCLPAAPAPGLDVRVPRGFRPEAVELTVRGRCADCR